MQYKGNIGSIACRYSEAIASEYLQDLEEMFPRYWYLLVGHSSPNDLHIFHI